MCAFFEGVGYPFYIQRHWSSYSSGYKPAGLTSLPPRRHYFKLIICIYMYNIFISSLSLCQAARVTHACERLKDMGPEVRARPYVYETTPLLDMDSLVSYLQTTRLRVSGRVGHW